MKLILFNEYALKCSNTQITLASRYQECNDINADLDSIKGECSTDIIYDDAMEDSSIKSENENDSMDQDIPRGNTNTFLGTAGNLINLVPCSLCVICTLDHEPKKVQITECFVFR